MRSWAMSALILAVLSVTPVPASAVSCLECFCSSESAHPDEIICFETAERAQFPGVACRVACGGFASIQPNVGACSLQAPNCTPDNTRTSLPPLPPAPVFSPWVLSFVAILVSLIYMFRLRRRQVRER